MDIELATEIRRHSIASIEALHDAVTSSIGKCTEEELEMIRYGVGSAIATISADLLSVIYEQFPELDSPE